MGTSPKAVNIETLRVTPMIAAVARAARPRRGSAPDGGDRRTRRTSCRDQDHEEGHAEDRAPRREGDAAHAGLRAEP